MFDGCPQTTSFFLDRMVGAFAQNIYVGIGIPHVVFGLMGIAILYGVLQIGGQKSGWSQLE